MPDPNPNPTPPPEQDDALQTEDVAALRSEAASRRRALRAEEAKSAALAARLDERDRQDIERLAADRLADPADLWLSTSLDAMRGEDGLLDMAKAEAELERVVSEKPHWRKPEPVKHPDLHAGATLGVAEPPPPPSFGQSIKRALRGG